MISPSEIVLSFASERNNQKCSCEGNLHTVSVISFDQSNDWGSDGSANRKLDYKNAREFHHAAGTYVIAQIVESFKGTANLFSRKVKGGSFLKNTSNILRLCRNTRHPSTKVTPCSKFFEKNYFK